MVGRSELDAITEGLKATIARIVLVHRSAGADLTWSLMHRIESEAMRAMEQSGNFDLSHLNTLRAYPTAYPRTDDLVNFGNATTLPIALSLIYREFRRSH
ncbi:hypothetical protein [Collimonas sp. PA-H2]|uniref:DUF2471 family protein n=1 Tax=Collimonas sp. PA-H2 TaxID=1881062 RepID=UPI00117F43C0|nr:hypothetical protein [Collimonas sp. PA-H2]